MSVPRNSPKTTNPREERHDELGLHKRDEGNGNDCKKDDKRMVANTRGIFIKCCSSDEVFDIASEASDSTLSLLDDEISLVEEFLQKFIIHTRGKSDSRVFDIVSKYGRKQTFVPAESILKQGDSGKGLYFILHGQVNILTSDDDEVINVLNVGDVFGEISTLFDIPVTANVRSAAVVTLVNLPAEVIMEFFTDVNDLDIIDWFIRRRYLPTGTTVDSSRIYRRLALKSFKHLQLLSTWTDEMLKRLVMSFEHNIVTLFPESSYIVLKGDPLTSVFILISGEIVLKQGSRIVRKINVDSECEPFVYTELALIADGKVSPVTIMTLSKCQVIQLNKGDVIRILEFFPDHMEALSEVARSFRISFKRLGKMYMKHEADLQIELVCFYLKQAKLYSVCPTEELWRKVLEADVQEFNEDCNVLLGVEQAHYESIVVIRGEVRAIFHDENQFEGSAFSGTVAHEPMEMKLNPNSVVREEASGICEMENIKGTEILTSSHVIDLQTVVAKNMTLKACTFYVILKMKKDLEIETNLLGELGSPMAHTDGDALKLV